jgi:rhodanese-related sulfurtransferase
MNIPGGVNVPGAELVYRVQDLAVSPETLVVVNCAGRTRSIIGAQSLINAGLRNEVAALRNGTMGWHLAGYPLEHGKNRRAPPPSAAGLQQAIDAAGRVGQRFGVRRIDHPTLERWRAERGERTLYLLDVRLPEDYAAGHRPDARNAPGGQLVQATDSYMATRNARVVLMDLHGVQATLTASWLVQMGWQEVYVLEAGLLPYGLAAGPWRPDIPGLAGADPPRLSPAELADALGTGTAAVLDLAPSPAYRAGHIPGAWFAIRAELEAARARLPAAARWVLTSPDGVLALLAAADARAAGLGEVAVLRGGTDAWRTAGHPLSQGAGHMASEPEDVFPKPYDREQGVEEAMQDYLRWEVELVRQVEAELPGLFRPFP